MTDFSERNVTAQQNNRRSNHSGITVISAAGKVALPNFRRLRHGGLTIAAGLEEMALSKFPKTGS
jgi:hypothetical protein